MTALPLVTGRAVSGEDCRSELAREPERKARKKSAHTSSFNSFRCLYTVARPMFSTLAT